MNEENKNTMTLREAYEVWAQENVRLSAKYRQANKEVLLDKYGDIQVTDLTEEFIRKIFSDYKGTAENRARASSTIMSIMYMMENAKIVKHINFSSETFRLNHDNEEEREAVSTVLREELDERRASQNELRNKLAGIQEQVDASIQKQKEKVRRPGLPGNARAVLKLDPKTLEVIKEYDCMSDACKDNGIKSLGTYIKGHHKGKGFYWCYPENLDDYREEIRAIQAKTDKKPAARQPKNKFPDVVAIPKDLYLRLNELGIIPNDVRSRNVGASDYSEHLIQPWSIWLEYGLNPWDADIIKRVLRYKSTDTRVMDYEKIIHICEERIRQLTGK